MTSDADWSEMVTVGHIVRPHGNRGHVVVASETDFGEERFRSGAVFEGGTEASRRTLTVAASRLHHGRWIVGFEGVGSIDDAEALRGFDLRIAASDVTPLGAGQYYLYQLTGCTVETTAGETVGVVARVDTGAGPARLVIDGRRGEVLVPFADEICRTVDVVGRRIVIEPLEGLVELNE